MAYIGNSPDSIQRGRRFIYEFTASAGQTVFSGTDDNNQTLDLLEANEQSVFLNGIRLTLTDDYTVSGDVLTLTSAASLNDFLVVETQAEIANISTYTRSESDARYINYNGDIISGDLQVVGNISVSSGDMNFGDNDKAIYGAGSDLQIYHDGSDSYVLDDGNGDLILRGSNNVKIQGWSGSAWIDQIATADNADVALYYSTNLRLATTSTGIDVTGTVTADAYALDSIALPSAGTATIFNRNTDNNLYIQTGSGNTVYLLDGSQNTMYAASPTSHVFQISNAEKMRLDSSGNVGIGTSSPSGGKLHITGSNYNDQLVIERTDTSSKWSLGGTTSGGFQVYDVNSANATRMTIDSSGNVGIGTDAPTARLDVRRGDADGKIAEFHQNTGYGIDIGSSQSVAYISSGYNQRLDFKTDPTSGQTERMSILANGNVGIGTTDVSEARLSVIGAGSGNYNVIQIRSSDAANIVKGGIVSFGQYDDASTSWTGIGGWDTGTARTIYMGGGGWGTQEATEFRVYTGSYDAGNGAAETRLTVDSTGDVGIGTTGPSARLDVVSNSASGYVAEFRESNASNFGTILIDSPTDGESRPSYMDYATGGTVKWSTGLAYLDAARSFHIGTGSGTSNSKVTITTDGKLGVGTTSPVSKLDVQYGILGTWEGATSTPTFVVGQNDAYRGISLRTVGDSNVGPSFHFERTRASGGATSDNDKLGQIVFNGTSGGYVDRIVAEIGVIQDGAAAAGWVPGTIQFKTTSVASSSTNEHVPRMTIKTDGNIEFTNDGTRSQHIGYKDYAYYFDYQPGKAIWTDTTEAGNNSLSHALMVRTPVKDSSNVAAIVIAENGGQASGKNGLWFRNEDFNSGVGYTKAKIYTEVGNSYNATSFYIDVATSSQNSAQRLQIDHNGTFYGSSSNNISDRRLKENIETITNPIEKIKGLTGRTFVWTEESTKADGKTKYGFIAQEVDTVVPDLVEKQTGLTYFDDNDNIVEKHESTNAAMSVNETGVIPILVEALKEALTEIDDLKARIEVLEG